MSVLTTIRCQYTQTVWGEATVTVDVEKLKRDYGSLDAMTDENWRDVMADAESYAPKGYDGLIEYQSSNVEEETFDDFSWEEPWDSTAPDTIDEARS